MDFSRLFLMQKTLDTHIQTNHGLLNEDLIDRKLLAFYVELGELANETRSFKFWSEKGPSTDEIILEEYVDGIHFILSVGIDSGFDHDTNIEYSTVEKVIGEDLVPYFFAVIDNVATFRNQRDYSTFKNLFTSYLTLGSALGFSENALIDAYVKKNEVNHQRQEQGY